MANEKILNNTRNTRDLFIELIYIDKRQLLYLNVEWLS